MHQITVTIGRGAGAEQEPLNETEWDAFRRVVQLTLAGAGWDLVVDSDGVGTYEGQTEENHVWVGIRETAEDLDDELKLNAHLRSTGRRFGQLEIAVGRGHSRLLDCQADDVAV